ncbi:hypothetical protein CRG98_024150 [Punica granatum]|uniref:Pentatricopeptide repeat-containing protein n=1 Tax=Punica granatum TaxID=22663 RepID=A0A2I0JGP4_PUNGR|nr:hypothetical protein CRG98_024150 [Punica granatum]
MVALLGSSMKIGFRLNSVSFNIIMKGWIRIGEREAAWEVLDQILERKVYPSVVTYNSLLGFLCRNRCVDKATSLFKNMKVKGTRPNAVTYELLMEGLCLIGKYKEAKNLMFDMEYRGCRVSEAYKVFLEMLVLGRKPNVATYHMMVDGLCKVDYFEGGLKVLSSMVRSQHCPRSEMFGFFVLGLIRMGNIGGSCFVIEEMVKRKVKVDLEAWEALVRSACGADGCAADLLIEVSASFEG